MPRSVPRAAAAELSRSDLAAHARLASLVAGGVRFEVARDEDGRLRVQRVGEDRGVLRSLVRGTLAIDGELDLHGMRAADAEAAVVRFVRRHAREGARAVRIVHGKGLHSEGGIPVLADVVLHALTEGGAAPVVRAIATPHEDDGGAGAVVVALGGAR